MQRELQAGHAAEVDVADHAGEPAGRTRQEFLGTGELPGNEPGGAHLPTERLAHRGVIVDDGNMFSSVWHRFYPLVAARYTFAGARAYCSNRTSTCLYLPPRPQVPNG